jgi:hypothetical protein
VTDLSVTVPATVAVNCKVPPVRAVAGDGETVTPVTVGGAVTVTVADADFEVSAALVAVTVSLPAVAGAVYKPADVTLPSLAVQVTDLSVTVPCTEAVN